MKSASLEYGAIPVASSRDALLSSAISNLAAEARSSHSTAQDAVLDALRMAIQQGLLPPGTWLRQVQLANVFGTGSRIPIREALRALEYEGLLTSEPHRGFRVVGLRLDQIEEIYELRGVLEGHALRVAIPLLTELDLEELRTQFEKMESAPDPDAALRERELFYLRLFSVTGRPHLVRMITGLRQDVARSLKWTLVRHSPHHHRLLFEAIMRGDAESAVAELVSHYRKVAGLIRRSYPEDRAGGPEVVPAD